MKMVDGRTWLEHIGGVECWQLLASVPVGRLGVVSDGAPEIYPVNHAVDDWTIVFRTDPGSKVRGLLRSPAVCFEVDGIDPAHETGWSVLLKGRAENVVDPDELRHLQSLSLRYWSLGDKEQWVRINPVEVTGRRIWKPADRPSDTPPA